VTGAMTPAAEFRVEALRWRERFARMLEETPPADDPAANFLNQLVRQVFIGAIHDMDAIVSGECPEDPRRLEGHPIGQYHCPRCGCMTLAGVSHMHDDGCWLGLNEVGPERPATGLLAAVRTSVDYLATQTAPDDVEARGEGGSRPVLENP
jgi:hypothetical protein